MKCFRYSFFVLFALLGVFFGSFIINQNNTYAVSWTSPDLSSYWSSTTIQQISLSSLGYSGSIGCLSFSYESYNPPVNQLAILQLSNDVNAMFTSSRIFAAFYFQSPSSISFSQPLNYNDVTLRFYRSYSAGDYLSGVYLTVSDVSCFSGGITPSGSLEITENGTYDVTNYAEAVVNVPETDCPPSSGGDYHEDLVAINNSIMICAATCLVIYFFYCIYRMIIKNSGVK